MSTFPSYTSIDFAWIISTLLDEASTSEEPIIRSIKIASDNNHLLLMQLKTQECYMNFKDSLSSGYMLIKKRSKKYRNETQLLF